MSTPTADAPVEPSTSGQWTVRKGTFYVVVLASLAFFAVVLGELLSLLVLGWTPQLATALGTHRLHVMGIAAFVGTIALAFAVQLYRPRTRVAPLVLALAATLAASVAIALITPDRIREAVPLFVMAVLLAALHPAGRAFFRGGPDFSPALLGLVALAAVPLVLYAAAQFSLQLSVADEHALDGHYVMMGLLALTILLGGVVAAVGIPGYRVAAWLVALLTAYFGAMSVAFPMQAGGIGVLWGGLAVLWALVFVAVTELSRQSGAPTVLRRPFAGGAAVSDVA